MQLNGLNGGGGVYLLLGLDNVGVNNASISMQSGQTRGGNSMNREWSV